MDESQAGSSLAITMQPGKEGVDSGDPLDTKDRGETNRGPPNDLETVGVVSPGSRGAEEPETVLRPRKNEAAEPRASPQQQLGVSVAVKNSIADTLPLDAVGGSAEFDPRRRNNREMVDGTLALDTQEPLSALQPQTPAEFVEQL